MAFIPVSQTCKAEVHCTWAGQTTINDLYFFLPAGEPTLAQTLQLAQDLDAWWSASVLINLNESLTYNFIRTRSLLVPNGFTAESASNSGPGGISGEAVPNNVNPCISFRTGVAGRSFRGRNYIPGLSNSDVTGNVLETAWKTALINAYTDLNPGGNFGTAAWNWVVVSYFTGGSPRAAGLVTPVISAIFTDDIVDSQRRRLPGRGK